MLRRGCCRSFEMFRCNKLMNKRHISGFSKDLPTVIPFELLVEERKHFDEERKYFEEERKHFEQERKHFEDERKVSEERLKNFYELLLKEKEEKYERLVQAKSHVNEELLEAKEFRIKEMKKHAEERVNGLHELIDFKDIVYARLETENLARTSEIFGITRMKPFIAVGCSIYTTNYNCKSAIEEFVRKELSHSEWVNARLTELEGNDFMLQDVRSVLNDLNDHLSKGNNNLYLRNRTGLICGGAKPFRMATALTLLRLQFLTLNPYEFTYADESYKPLKILSFGNVIDLR